MRKFIMGLLVLACLQASAQKQERKDSTAPRLDSLTLNTPLLSLQDYKEFVDSVVQDMPARYADAVRQWWIDRLNKRVADRQKKK